MEAVVLWLRLVVVQVQISHWQFPVSDFLVNCLHLQWSQHSQRHADSVSKKKKFLKMFTTLQLWKVLKEALPNMDE